MISTIPCPLAERARQSPGAAAIVARHRTYTFEDWHRAAACACEALRANGVREGDVVCIGLPPCTPYPILLMGLARLGAAAFPVDTRFPVRYLLDLLGHVHCRAMIAPYGTSIAAGHAGLTVLSPGALILESPPPCNAAPTIDLDRPVTVVLTSGSSGAPKAAVHTFGNHYHNALRSNANLPLGPGDRWLLSLPLHHVSGLGVVFRCLAAGAATAIPPAKESLVDCIARLRITHVSLVATQLMRLMKSPEGRSALHALKAILLGGGPLPEPLVREAHAMSLPLYTTYGMTEMASQISTSAPRDPLPKLLSAGKPLAPDTVRINAGDEIEVRGETLFRGFFDGAELQRPLTADGWFATGDRGALDADGYLHVLGRKDNMFVAGGENIQPEEIEAALQELPGVLRAIVAPVADAEFGHLPAAFVEMDDGSAPDAEAIRTALRARLPHFKVPRAIWPWPEEFGGDQKPKRREFAALAAQRIE